eukprot:CAMPEP_0204335646 /NCGR_PEP_ID=MMETSP0469-20131031/18942_1 /ASSEMBLY_ACC=CAM_ASM_000384 /TAXON_ID=2969 /ORGANISM="Oxyrrhis marina" /LENGTH=42 /DNA_ID= /DNA_START= /DNA_END= /DNA_ORIENTATION=
MSANLMVSSATPKMSTTKLTCPGAWATSNCRRTVTFASSGKD